MANCSNINCLEFLFMIEYKMEYEIYFSHVVFSKYSITSTEKTQENVDRVLLK